MEHASTLSTLSLPKNLRTGQAKTIRLFETKKHVIAKLPTGYGKTLTAACSYAVLRDAGLCTRMLHIVPRCNQCSQAASSVPKSLLRHFNIKTMAYEIGDNPIRALRAHQANTAEVFMITIQALATSAAAQSAVDEMMAKGKWFVVIDEHHHYSCKSNGAGADEYSQWAAAIKRLNSDYLLAMSATPMRRTGDDMFGKPDVDITYFDAWKEEAVKEMHLNAYEYQLDVITSNNEVASYTTGEVLDMFGTDADQIDEEMAKQNMRWSPKYISPLVTIPAGRMASLRVKGIRSQMIVQAMSCKHAAMVCKQIKALLPTLNVNWVGTGPNGKTDYENKKIIVDFCPEENNDGERLWTLDVLVNVGMAGEGLDTRDCTEVVVLTRANITTSLLQLMGRGARAMTVLPGMSQPICYINVDTDSEVGSIGGGKYIGKKIMAVFDEDITIDDIEEDVDREAKDDIYEELPETLSVIITDVRLVDIKTDPAYEPLVNHYIENGKWSEVDARIEAEKFMREWTRQRDESMNATATLALSSTKVDGALQSVVRLIGMRIREAGMRTEQSLFADLYRRINSWKKKQVGRGVSESNMEELTAHYDLLKQLERQILLEIGLQGLPKWLR